MNINSKGSIFTICSLKLHKKRIKSGSLFIPITVPSYHILSQNRYISQDNDVIFYK